MDFPKRLIERGGIGLPSRVEPHIYKLPPSSRFTRKKERVTESDVMWMTRPDGSASDPSRINEAISYFKRGSNPSVAVSYQNFGGPATRTPGMHQPQAGAVYKLDVVRPPLFPVETLHSLSNPRTHQVMTVETNPGLPGDVALNSIAGDYDTAEAALGIAVQKSSGPRTLQSTPEYTLDLPSEMSATFAINENRREMFDVVSNPGKSANVNDFVCREQTPYGVIIRPTYSVTSNVSGDKFDSMNGDASAKVRKEVLLQNIRPNYNIVLYDSANHVSTEVSANIKERNYIAVQAALGRPITLERQNGTPIKLANYTWTAVQTNLGTDQVILSIEDPNIQLERNLPVYATSTGLSAPTDVLSRRNQDYDLEAKLGAVPEPTLDLSTLYNMENIRDLQGMTKLNKQTFNFSFDNEGTIPMQFVRQLPDLNANANLKFAANAHYDRLFE